MIEKKEELTVIGCSTKMHRSAKEAVRANNLDEKPG